MTAALAVVAVVFLLAYGGLWLLEVAGRLIVAVVTAVIWLPLAVVGVAALAVERATRRRPAG